MLSQQNLSSIVVLTAGTQGKIQSMDVHGNALSLEKHNKEIEIIFAPILWVEKHLVYRDYELYLFVHEEDFNVNKTSIAAMNENALVLLITRGLNEESQITVCFIEDHVCLEPVSIRCINHAKVINEFKTDIEGKVQVTKANEFDISMLIKYIRCIGGRGNEVGIKFSRTGTPLFSQDFAACNAVVAKPKIDNLFALYHAVNSHVGLDSDGVRDLLTSIHKGKGSSFTAVMQNPHHSTNSVKSFFIAGRLAAQMQDKNVCVIHVKEGYRAIACINSNTIILTKEMEFFQNKEEINKMLERISNNKDPHTIKNLQLQVHPLNSSNDFMFLPKIAEELIALCERAEDDSTKLTYIELLTKLINAPDLLSEEMKQKIETYIEEQNSTRCCFIM
ncbi:hypothetical protein [Legionella fallonii]|uniref:Uncharacterized protein n=1 Tax=Legionella fallonii LLAP-10 TaxID=1212491 RepID=A0A098G5X7_9GAMM|nr:hypothetical protein [Legionella fallonii]CEG57371.1 protein of unknown function [Legionella fallonii LLAP-10]